jgi:beta-lactamase superfamily II metal-dependent hydrolase
MAKGWVRAYSEENSHVNSSNPYSKRTKRALFRKSFKTALKATADENSNTLKTISWGSEVELPNGLSKDSWTEVTSGTKQGFVHSKHLVEVAYVKRKGASNKSMQATMEPNYGGKKKILWGDLVQITKPGTKVCEVRIRGVHGKMKTTDLTDKPLLELYFVDVTQGDGVYVLTPDRRHLLIDGGYERTKQLTGKNAADFVDWKFFFDYGHYDISLDSMMASHSDNDHYGGLHDLVRQDSIMADREQDCLKTNIKVFHHPGLSRWSNNKTANPPHKYGLGAFKDDAFIQLLDDRADAEKAVNKTSKEKLSGPWKYFIEDLLENSKKTKVERILLTRKQLDDGDPLPLLWPTKECCEIKILGPVAHKVGNKLGLKNFGSKSYNTNGHSICLRIDYGNAKILLTGDLNKESMDYIETCYGDRMGVWECDVAKACHHGSDDISFKFLEKIKSAATIISSGDAEGHAHPRPEIVGASAVTGFKNVDRTKDKLITPLVYMTEIERSVSLGAINRIDFKNLTVGTDKIDGAILGRNLDELSDKGYLTYEDRKEYDKLPDSSAKSKFLRELLKDQKPIFEAMQEEIQNYRTNINFNISVPQGALSPVTKSKRAWKARVMEKNHYGLVNVRTDGDIVMCATLDETAKKWVINSFPARF